ncbi:MAG: hypothetical protein IKF10_06485, partial [Lachnospiraceae bacterium]|nr:hypothetical protein [Lachnospiraceae bacterium]
ESKLAMVQNEIVKGILENEGYEVSILTVSTKGDRDKKTAVTKLGGNGPFVRDVEQALLDGKADVAVHCVKDLPYDGASGLVIAGILDEADPGDVLLMKKGMIGNLRLNGYVGSAEGGTENRLLQPVCSDSIRSKTEKRLLQSDCFWSTSINTENCAEKTCNEENIERKDLIIGTGSPRRKVQLMRLFPNITCTDIRGNITTRMDKLRDGQYDGIVLARAGLDRIGAELSEFDVVSFAPHEMIPAVGQGLLAVQCREEDTEMRDLLFRLSPARAYLRFMIEREVFCRYRLNCRDAVGVYADIDEALLKANILLLAEPVSVSDNDDSADCESVGRN